MRSWAYIAAVATFWALFHFFGWWGVALLCAFGFGWHLCYRVLRGEWMPPED